MAPSSQSDVGQGERDDTPANRPPRPAATLRPASKVWYKALDDLNGSYRGSRAQYSRTTMVQTRARTRQADGKPVDRPNYDVRYHSDNSLGDESDGDSRVQSITIDDEDGGYHDDHNNAEESGGNERGHKVDPENSKEFRYANAWGSQPEVQHDGHVAFTQASFQPQVSSNQLVFHQKPAPFVRPPIEAQPIGIPQTTGMPQYVLCSTGANTSDVSMSSQPLDYMNPNINSFVSLNTVPDSTTTLPATYYGVNPSNIDLTVNAQSTSFYPAHNRGSHFEPQNTGTANAIRGAHMSDLYNAQLGHSGISGSQESHLGFQRPASTNMKPDKKATGTKDSLFRDDVIKCRKRRRDTNELPNMARRNRATANSSLGYSGRSGRALEASGNFDLTRPYSAIGQQPNALPLLTNPNQLLGLNFNQPWNASLGSKPPSLNPSIADRFVLSGIGGLASPRVSPGPSRSQTPNYGSFSAPRDVQNSRMNTPEISPVKLENEVYPDNRSFTGYPPSHPGYRRQNYGAAPFTHSGGLASIVHSRDGMPGHLRVGQSSTQNGSTWNGTHAGAANFPNRTNSRQDHVTLDQQGNKLIPQIRRPPDSLRQDGKPCFYPYPVDQSIAEGSWRREPSQPPIVNQDGVRIVPTNYQLAILSRMQAAMSHPDVPDFARQATEDGLNFPLLIERRYTQMVMWQTFAAYEMAKAGVHGLFVIQRKSLLQIDSKHSEDYQVRFLAAWVETTDGAFWVTEEGGIYDVGDKKLIDMKHFFNENFPGLDSLPSPNSQIRAGLLGDLPVIYPTFLHASPSNQNGQGITAASSPQGIQGGCLEQAVPSASDGYGVGVTGMTGQAHMIHDPRLSVDAGATGTSEGSGFSQ